ncbi:dephospho-CoA kinase [Budvicia diplopodorum]|uniref:dephospho-CoA kinase n=1 Tax=Budvicia diplopodorum TaxID=1119056 RepID=UPI001357F2A1|nr:dephospho-CoA kinase [Budvicia diplopodorum]
MSYIVALTGGIGSGKSTVSDEFSRLGVPVIDADIIAREVVEPGTVALQAIAQHFGVSMIQPDGKLDRKRLRAHIFSHPDEKQWLNNLLHPLIQQETRRKMAAIKAPYILWAVPLLVENNLCSRANRILVVDVSTETQLQRTMARDGSSQHQAEQIIAAQSSRQARLLQADDVINNDGSSAELINQIEHLHQKYLTLAHEFNKQDSSI